MQVHCEFRVPACEHGEQPMFSTEYKRSNRTRMSKILRCFPHCCPTHRPRSYCGSTLHLHVSLTPADESDNHDVAASTTHPDEDEPQPWTVAHVASPTAFLQQVIVYGRFEVHDPDEPFKSYLALGQRVPAASIQQNSEPDVIWVQGKALAPADSAHAETSESTTVSHVFVLNEDDGVSHHWEYDWRSGTSQRKRASLHKFRAYVLQVDSTDPLMWQVIGMVGSTAFTLSSYRKQDDEDFETAEATTAAVAVSARHAGAFNPAAAAPTEPSLRPVLPLPPPPQRVSVADDALIVRYHQPTVQATTRLAIWINFLSVIDVSWVAEDTIVGHASTQLSHTRDSPSDDFFHRTSGLIARRGAHAITHALTQTSPVLYDRYSHSVWFQKWRGLVTVCIDVLCELLTDERLGSLRDHIRRAAVEGGAARDEQLLLSSYITFVNLLSGELDAVVRGVCDRESLDQLVDEMISSVYFHDPEVEWIDESTRSLMRKLLRNTRLLGVDWYREQVNQCAHPVAVPTARSDLSVLFSGVWSFVTVEDHANRVRHPPTPEFSFSATTVIGALTTCRAFELAMDANGTRLLGRSGWAIFPEVWSILVLDGRLHTGLVLPHGVVPSLWRDVGAGSVIGDHRSSLRQTEDGSLVLDLDLFAFSTEAPSFCLQITAVPIVSTAADNAFHQLQVHARVYRCSPSARLRDMGRRALCQLSPEQRSELVHFTAEDLIVQLMFVFEHTPVFVRRD